MNYFKNVFNFILIILIFDTSLMFSQNDNIIIHKEKEIISRSNPYLPHAISINDYQGFSLGLSYPGFFSYYGQLNLYYNDSSNNSYFGGIGFAYLMVGTNINIVELNSSRIYLNLNLGIVEEGLLGSFGLSYMILNKEKIGKLELTLDLYFHHGKFYHDFITVDTPYLRGIATNIYFNTNLSDRWSLQYGLGLSLIQYRIMFWEGRNEYVYVTKHHEDTSHNLSNPKWDSKIIFPFGISLTYYL